MTPHQTGNVGVSKDVDFWEDRLSLPGVHMRKSDKKSPMCLCYDELHDGRAKRFCEEQLSEYPFSRPTMTNTTWLSSAEMSLLDFHTASTRTVKPTCTMAD